MIIRSKAFSCSGPCPGADSCPGASPCSGAINACCTTLSDEALSKIWDEEWHMNNNTWNIIR